MKSIIRIQFIWLILLLGCLESPHGGPHPPEIGYARFYFHNVLGHFDSVDIYVSEIKSLPDYADIVFSPPKIINVTRNIDAIDGLDSLKLLLDTAKQPEWFRVVTMSIKIDAIKITDNSESYDVAIPKKYNEILLNCLFNSTEWLEEYIIDFNSVLSIIKTIDAGGMVKYVFNPKMRLFTKYGRTIQGTVVNPIHRPIAYSIVHGDTISAVPVNIQNGRFSLHYINLDETYNMKPYFVTIIDTLSKSWRIDNFNFVSQSIIDLGSIELK